MGDTSIVEVRTYYMKPGRRDEFVELFQSRARPVQERYGIKVLGLLIDLERDDTVVWLRRFGSPEERERLKDDFYGGPEWTDELEARAMPLIERWDVVVARSAPGALDGWL